MCFQAVDRDSQRHGCCHGAQGNTSFVRTEGAFVSPSCGSGRQGARLLFLLRDDSGRCLGGEWPQEDSRSRGQTERQRPPAPHQQEPLRGHSECPVKEQQDGPGM